MLAVFVMFVTGILAIAREMASDYMHFSAADARLADFIRDETPPGSRFITGTQHTNPVSSLAGREIVCGPDLWLYYHGFDTRARQEDLARFYQNPAAFADIPQKYGADYILLGPHERGYQPNQGALEERYERVYEDGDILLYKVPEG